MNRLIISVALLLSMTVTLPAQAAPQQLRTPAMTVTTLTEASTADLQAAFNKATSSANRKVTYKTRGKSWFVVSGYEKGKIFYQKSRLDRGQLHTFVVRYRPDQKKAMDSVIAQLEREFPNSPRWVAERKATTGM